MILVMVEKTINAMNMYLVLKKRKEKEVVMFVFILPAVEVIKHLQIAHVPSHLTSAASIWW